MKRIFSAIVAVCIIFSGCSKTLGTQVNEFTVADATKAQETEVNEITAADTTKAQETEVNEFTASDAIRGQVGELYYVVPSNAVVGEYSSDSAMTYEIPIDNSAEKYWIHIIYLSTDDIESSSGSIQEYIDSMKSYLKALREGTIPETEIVECNETSEIFGITSLYSVTSTCKQEGTMSKNITFMIDSGCYSISYNVDTAFYDEAIWDNFYSQLKLV